MNAILVTHHLSKRFGQKLALDNIGFEIAPGRVVGLLGPNGAGKTTLMKTLMQIYSPDAGGITWFGKPLDYHARQGIAYMPDQNHLFTWMRVRDAIHYYQDMFADFDISRAKELCRFLRLNENDPIQTLSKGTIECALIMLTFARHARLYLLDEPIGGMDPLARQRILKTILSGIHEDSAVLLSTHLVKDVETVLDDIYFLNEGRLILADPAEKIRAERGMSIEELYLEMFENA
ncbi:ABC-type multidrug transport system, ATPase component [Longilinea arvoryzae]|uniref:ABC-type multidrug transport system, ATPase component n=1 Tax=Longilinea arvoryzae TaxID=360412 RepID=A0A0S7BDH2_9CHLR|nr:ABC transporter ATP-binding protein [Longilinea arvoryzae]GAP13385.1 ABC-type multidrug transport system, ATPase component [Longilinea arvoryzae]